MKIDLNCKIQRLDGTDYIDLEADGVNEDGQPKFKESKPMTVRKAIVDALTSIFKDDEKLEGKKKALRGWLAMKVWKHTDPIIDLSVDDVKLCKDLIGKRFNPLIILQAWDILDPNWKD